MRAAQAVAGRSKAHRTAERIRGGEPVSDVLSGHDGDGDGDVIRGTGRGTGTGPHSGFDRRVARASAQAARRRGEVERLAGEAQASE